MFSTLSPREELIALIKQMDEAAIKQLMAFAAGYEASTIQKETATVDPTHMDV